MTTKFPTPNWSKLNGARLVSSDLYKAVQADIALAVEAARVTVPDGVRDYLDLLIGPISKDSDLYHLKVAARRLLESLTAEAKAAPVEKRCETCAANREVAEDAQECLRRQRDMPWTNENYHCWKAKP